MKALIVDDSATTRYMIKKLLKEAAPGISCMVEAENGSVALQRLQENPDVQIAFVDWNMPVMNGLEFVVAARQRVSDQQMKIIMVTTETQMTAVVQALEAGVNEYVMKPFTKESLAEKLQIVGL